MRRLLRPASPPQGVAEALLLLATAAAGRLLLQLWFVPTGRLAAALVPEAAATVIAGAMLAAMAEGLLLALAARLLLGLDLRRALGAGTVLLAATWVGPPLGGLSPVPAGVAAAAVAGLALGLAGRRGGRRAVALGLAATAVVAGLARYEPAHASPPGAIAASRRPAPATRPRRWGGRPAVRPGRRALGAGRARRPRHRPRRRRGGTRAARRHAAAAGRGRRRGRRGRRARPAGPGALRPRRAAPPARGALARRPLGGGRRRGLRVGRAGPRGGRRPRRRSPSLTRRSAVAFSASSRRVRLVLDSSNSMRPMRPTRPPCRPRSPPTFSGSTSFWRQCRWATGIAPLLSISSSSSPGLPKDTAVTGSTRSLRPA